MNRCKSISTPMSTVDKLSKTQGKVLTSEETTKYRNTVGALPYLAITRPDISFAVNKVCQFLQSPTTEHWSAVKHILRYLKHTSNVELAVQKSASDCLSAFLDTD